MRVGAGEVAVSRECNVHRVFSAVCTTTYTNIEFDLIDLVVYCNY